MIISATIKNSYQTNELAVTTNNQIKSISIPGKAEGYGSSVNGGELLFLALATCFCNDVYREAARRKMLINSVEVTVSGAFGQEGEPASDINYTANIQAPDHTSREITDLINHVDKIAEIHNTLREGVSVTLQN